LRTQTEEKSLVGKKRVDNPEKTYIVGDGMRNLNLILHCGGSVATRNQLAEIKTPSPEGRWHPIPHTELITQVESRLSEHGMRIVNESFGLANDGARMFGLMQVANGKNSDDYSWVAGLRNSHDKTFPAGLCVGSGVFVCDNLAFSSEIVFGRKHTTNILRDLPVLVGTAIGKLSESWTSQDKRIEAYKETELSKGDAANLLLDALSQDVINTRQILPAFQEWRKPRHEEFAERSNVWRLFNSVTEVLKPTDGKNKKGHYLFELPARTQRWHAICDSACGLEIAKAEVSVN